MRPIYPLAILIVFVSLGCPATAISQDAGDGQDLLHPLKPDGAATRPSGLSYSLSDGSANWDTDARDRIVKAMDAAVAVYNANGEFKRHVTANYSPGTPTADANFGGWINFGGQIGTRTALHEIAHTMGVGTCEQWQRFARDGKWTGTYAIEQLKEIDGPDAVLHCDHQHFWPYGLNYDQEGGEENFKHHVKMVIALRADMGLGPPPGISVAALQAARVAAMAAHAKVGADQKALDALPAILRQKRASRPETIQADQSASAAKAANDAAVARVLKKLQDDPDFKSATDGEALARNRLDEMKAATGDDPSSQKVADAASALLTSESTVEKLKERALAADPQAVESKKAYAASLQAQAAARAAAVQDEAPELRSAKSALASAQASAAAADQHVIEVQEGLAKEKSRHEGQP
jgi:hypothetical protein